jgi:hypothetical protein
LIRNNRSVGTNYLSRTRRRTVRAPPARERHVRERNKIMRMSLIDLLLFIAFLGASSALGLALAPSLLKYVPPILTYLAAWILGLSLYLAILCPVYRKLRLFPMVLPRCPCCGQHQQGFHFTRDWPRVTYKCPSCNGEFIIWHNGEPGVDETWDKPVLALKWPYALGRYKKMIKPEPSPSPYGSPGPGSPSGEA